MLCPNGATVFEGETPDSGVVVSALRAVALVGETVSAVEGWGPSRVGVL